MSDTNLEILAILRHYYKQGFKATDAARIICQFEGEDAISERTSQNWYKRFKSGDMSLQIRSRSGRPCTMDLEALQQSVQSNPTTSTRRLSNELGASKDTIGRALHKLGKVNRRCREVPHDLNAQQAKNRVDVCKKLLENPKDERFLKRIVTSDEKWIYLNNPNNRNQWLDRGESAKPVVKLDRFQEKAMLCVWWNYEQVIHYELVPDGQTINSDLYCEQLDRMYESLLVKYPALVNRGQVLLQHDNAKPHTSRKTKEKITKMHGIQLMPHPAYSPDLAPSDYHMFRSMATFFKGRRFVDVNDVENGCREFFSSKPKTWYHHGIQQLAQRWLLTIENDGMYFEA